MAIFRLYTGDDGLSHMEELDMESHPELTTLHSSKAVVFPLCRTRPLQRLAQCPPPPVHHHSLRPGRNRLSATAASNVSAPATLTLAEDITGSGHTTRVVGDAPRVTATVHLED